MGPTPSQLAAIECDDHLILFAGPGSGKTSTSIKKAVRVLEDPDRRLILCTFSVEAAGELRGRLERAFAAMDKRLPANRVQISTLDSLSYRHLFAQPGILSKLNFLSPPAQTPMLRAIVSELGLPKLDDLSPWLERYQSALNREEVTQLLESQQPEALLLIKAYLERLKSAGLVDLATIKRTCALGMKQGTIPPFTVAGQRVTDFLIDEVQDSDELQLLMARTMADAGAITTLVGDDDQTIYSWRSACGYKGMLGFIEHTKANVVRLGENFRSHSEIVEVSTRLIAFNNPDRVDKQQRSMRGPGGNAICVSLADLSNEAKWICADIKSEIDKGAPPRTRAILARRNIALNEIEAKLSIYKIPYHRNGASLWDRPEIVSYLHLLSYTASGSLESLSLTLSTLEFSGDLINQILAFTKKNPSFLFKDEVNSISTDSPLEKKKLEQFATSVAMWKKQLKQGWISRVINDSADALINWMRGEKKARLGDEEPVRIQRARQYIDFATEALESRKGSLMERVRSLQKSKKAEPKPGEVRLMTMHASKGLEFDTVYLADCAESEDDGTLTAAADERRVLYVGMTRAERELRITFSGKLPIFLKQAGITQVSATCKPSSQVSEKSA